MIHEKKVLSRKKNCEIFIDKYVKDVAQDKKTKIRNNNDYKCILSTLKSIDSDTNVD